MAALAALGLLAATTWQLPARTGPPTPRLALAPWGSPGACCPRHLLHGAARAARWRLYRCIRRPMAGARQASARPPTHVRPTPRSTLRHAVMARATSPPAPLGPGVPMRLGIPALGLRTAIEPVGLRAGALDVPTHVWHVGWFKLGPRPGAVGNAVIDGHLDSTTRPAIFLALHTLHVARLNTKPQGGHWMTGDGTSP